MTATARIFNICQQTKYMTEDMVKQTLINNASDIERYAWITHNKDIHTQNEYEEYKKRNEQKEPEWQIGQHKEDHIHVVIQFKKQKTANGVAKMFGIQAQYVDIPKGNGAGKFLDCVGYLDHADPAQQEKGKHVYDAEEVHVSANFADWKQQVTAWQKRRAKARDKAAGVKIKDWLRDQVLYEGMTLRQVREQYPDEYAKDFGYLEKCRIRYISQISEMPKTRINYYVEGKGGMGKGIISRAIAKAIVDPRHEMADDEIFFEVGSNNSTFEGYDGQAVVIWNDCRAFTLLEKLGGRENVFNVFDPFPPGIKQNIKYGSIRLNNVINIVNSVQPWKDFMDGLAGEYTDKQGNVQRAEDKSQSYRRFPFFIILHEEDYDLGMNNGIFKGTREFEQYTILQGIQGNMQRIADVCGKNIELKNKIADQCLKPVVAEHKVLEGRLDHEQKGSDEEILEMFKNYGTGGIVKKE